ncbi:type VI secretion system baseplate subunit TssF [Helicobacter saguini]|uniref:Type VI secretion system baseplate subunit TssF n=1 Tax=Helicobacter saguini TaxID=1548018 RepID=A0A347VNY6_9HELI|nr:type VI secretion system baseplate subunit TssF [Helicobacter saguini]MWV61583.1 type VI secretion system baseplate subunit TssF [Helicobacter saguini]MWV67746.1 type VI secretion system baseplate subunit TssF [Helicobacter saguini]MWV70786.1 type VI secretion system baseplate subunit TssF [Helicobacter saguini]MWV72690.1 type VI secretion system baseplate subunit TssF [Helicobacter saguini]TLD94509.1 type VI secretion system baseplate subunit TssF [Helicobacter saguini]
MDENIYYYKKELDYLHKMRSLFINNFPKLAPFLSYNSNDPDIERLIENFAILTAKLHQELDNNLPLIAESLINIISPNYTNPLPSVCIQDFILKTDSKENEIFIPKNTEVKSIPIDEIECRFKTLYDINLYPLALQDCHISNVNNTYSMIIYFNTTKDININELNISYLNIYLGNDIYTSTSLLMWMLYYLQEVIVIFENGEEFKILPSFVEHIGLDSLAFGGGENGFEAFSLLQELFFVPEKFNFIRINQLEILKRCSSQKFNMKFNFTKPLPHECMPRVDMFSLFATPIINKFHISAEPIVNNHNKESYRIFINQNKVEYYEIIEILKVKAHNSDTGKRILKNYKSFERFGIFDNDRLNDFYSSFYKKDIYGHSYRHISFFSQSKVSETISIETISCNKNLPTHLKMGEVNKIDNKDIQTRNITMPTSMKRVDIDGEIIWKLVATLSFNYQSILEKQSFLNILESYSFLLNKEKDNIAKKFALNLINITQKPIYTISGNFAKKGVLCTMSINQNGFYSLGEIYRMGLVFSKFLASFASLNSFCELEIKCINRDYITTISYPYKDGKKATM